MVLFSLSCHASPILTDRLRRSVSLPLKTKRFVNIVSTYYFGNSISGLNRNYFPPLKSRSHARSVLQRCGHPLRTSHSIHRNFSVYCSLVHFSSVSNAATRSVRDASKTGSRLAKLNICSPILIMIQTHRIFSNYACWHRVP